MGVEETSAEFPVVEIVVKVPISSWEEKVFKDALVFHDIEAVKDIKTELLGLNQSNGVEFLQRILIIDKIVRIGCPNFLIFFRLQNGTGKGVKREEV